MNKAELKIKIYKILEDNIEHIEDEGWYIDKSVVSIELMEEIESYHQSRVNDISDEEVLFKIHTHAELCNPEEIVYKQKDILELINKLKQ